MHLEFGLKATTRFSLESFKAAFDTVKRLMAETVLQFEEFIANLHETDAAMVQENSKSFEMRGYYEKAIGL